MIDEEACLISTLRIGDKIGSQTTAGTLGGFVKYYDYYECFLTCAHVMYDMQTLFGPSFNCSELNGPRAYCYIPNNEVECGKVIWGTFNHDEILETSVDAALVMLQNDWKMDPNDYVIDLHGKSYPFPHLGLSTPYLNSSILDHETLCDHQVTTKVVGWGAETQLQENVTFLKNSLSLLSLGQAAVSANGNTFDQLLMHTQVHMQSTAGYLTDRRVFRMYNQIGIDLKLGSGDSGTCIYVVKLPNNKGCIGMVIGRCGSLAIVTPLKDIFKRMGIETTYNVQ